MNASTTTVELLGTRYARLDPAGALERIEQLAESDPPVFVVYANVHTLNLAAHDPSYQAVLDRAHIVLNDGKGVMVGARLAGTGFAIDMNGNFFTPLLLQLAARSGWRIYLLGAAPGVARRAAERLEDKIVGLRIAGVRDGFFSDAEEGRVVETIRAARTDLLLVGLGNPKQERWLAKNLAATGAHIGVGVGAFLDFQAGEVSRAPRWIRRLGLEWVHRLLTEPRRMWRRYLLGNPLFLARVLKARLMRRRTD